MERPYNVEGTLMEQYLRREHIGCEAEVPETLKKRSGKEGEIFFFRRTVDRWPCRLAYHEREKNANVRIRQIWSSSANIAVLYQKIPQLTQKHSRINSRIATQQYSPSASINTDYCLKCHPEVSNKVTRQVTFNKTKIVEDAKIEKFKCDILSDFQTMCPESNLT